MKIKVSALIGPALDWAVAKCELQRDVEEGRRVHQEVLESHASGEYTPDYSDNWSLTGPIIQREEISINRDNEPNYIWAAWTCAPLRDESEAFGYGNTQLIAACRCYVESILGEEVEVPESLTWVKDFTGKSKIEILHSFGYEVTNVDVGFKAFIVEDPESFSVTTKSQEQAIDEAYQFLLCEIDPDIGHVFPKF